MNLKNTLISNYTRRLNALPPDRKAAITDAVQQQNRHVVLTFDAESGTTIANLTGEVTERLWHLPMSEEEAEAIAATLPRFLNELDPAFQASVRTLLETGAQLMLGMTASKVDPELRVMLHVNGQIKPLANWIDPVTTIH